MWVFCCANEARGGGARAGSGAARTITPHTKSSEAYVLTKDEGGRYTLLLRTIARNFISGRQM